MRKAELKLNRYFNKLQLNKVALIVNFIEIDVFLNSVAKKF